MSDVLTPEFVASFLPHKVNQLYVAYSGGIDSHVLLHLLSSTAKFKTKITAVYVHHGLQPEADQWSTHCQKITLDLGVRFQLLKVNTEKTIKQNQEEVARNMRYNALKTVLSKNDVLLLAQHQEDQLETVLLQLFRGAGIQGLSGMPLSVTFGLGIMCRPLLNVSKKSIINYAQHAGLCYVEDPSNKVNRFERNFLRNKIIPQLKQHWPALDKTVSRCARHCANSQTIIQNLSASLLHNISSNIDQTLTISRLHELDINKQHLVIRRWFADKQFRMPAEKTLHKILDVTTAKLCSNPEVRGKGYCIRRYRDKLFFLPSKQECQIFNTKNWSQKSQPLKLDHRRELVIFKATEGIDQDLWQNSIVLVNCRKGAEKIRLPKRHGHHKLKKLFQEQAIPPWERNNIPLIYINGELAAVADLWISADFFSNSKSTCYQFKLLLTEN